MRILSLFLVCTLCFPLHAEDAAMFRGDPEHSGLYRATGVPKFTKVKWQFHTNGPVMSSPAVVGGTLFVGSNDHNLYAIDAETGAQRWKFKTGSRITSSPASVDGIVYFSSYDGNFYAVDAGTGQQKWKFQTGGEHRYTAKHLHGTLPAGEAMPDPFDFFLSSPAVTNGIVYFGSGDGNVYALSGSDGALKWKFQTGDVVHSSPAVANGLVYAGSWDTYFYAIDAVSGKEKWRFKTGDDPDIHNQIGIQSSPLVTGGVVYFGCRDSNFYALDAATGKKKWAFNNKGSWVIGSPVASMGTVYFATSDSAAFHAVDLTTGSELFTLDFRWPMFSSPAIAGNILYIGTHEGKLFAVDVTAKQIAWSFQTDASKEHGPALTRPDGKPKYEAAFRDNFYDDIVAGMDKLQSVGMVLSSPVVVDNVVYFGSTDGNIYALM